MRRMVFAVGLALAAVSSGCRSDGPTSPGVKPPKPDPYVTILVIDNLDTTTAAGRASWKFYSLLSGPQANQNGVSYAGFSTLSDRRRDGNYVNCLKVGADSVGQRFIAPFAIADTTTEGGVPNSQIDSIAQRWWAGNHAPPPSQYLIITMNPTDAWTSAQYSAGHGLVPSDPIRWSWTWSSPASTAFVERAASDTASAAKCSTF